MVLLGRLGLGIGLVFMVRVRLRFSVWLSFNNNLLLSHFIHSFLIVWSDWVT